jgi:hypothetical protein
VLLLVELRELCRRMDLATSGNKSDLVLRLMREELALEDLSKQQLQGMCEAEELPRNGSKQTLVKRLEEAQGGHAAASGADSAGSVANMLRGSAAAAGSAGNGGVGRLVVNGTGDGNRVGKAGKMRGERGTEVYEAVSKARAKTLVQQEQALAEVQRAPRAMVR